MKLQEYKVSKETWRVWVKCRKARVDEWERWARFNLAQIDYMGKLVILKGNGE